MNIAYMLRWSAQRHADKVAFITPEVRRTFAEMEGRTNALASALRKLGVEKGDRVGVLIGNQIEYPEAEFSIVKTGAIRVPMLITSSVDEVRHFIELAEPKLIFASGNGLPTVREAIKRADRDVRVIAVGEAVGGELNYEDLIAGESQAPQPVDLVEDDAYALRFTGGTTGAPKGVLMSHRCMINLIYNMILNWSVPFDEVVCHIHPLSHAAGKIMYTWWMRGATQVILPAFNFKADGLLAAIERERITTLMIMPTALNVLLDSGLLDKYDTSSIRTIIYGGAPIPPSRIQQGLKAFGNVFIQLYGSSEAPNALTTLLKEDHVFDPDQEPPARLRSAGRVGYGVEVKVVDEAGRECLPGEVGEIISRGPHTFSGYWKNPEMTAERVIDGWVYTRDMGYFDEDGYLYLVDRKDDMVITGGFNVWPAEVEAVICEYEGVGEAAVFGVADEKWGEAIVAVVVPKPDQALSDGELLTFLRGQLTAYKVPKRIIVREEPIPKSPVHKPLRRSLRDEYRDLMKA